MCFVKPGYRHIDEISASLRKQPRLKIIIFIDLLVPYGFLNPIYRLPVTMVR